MNEITKNTIEFTTNTETTEKCNIEISKDNRLILRIDKDYKLRYIGSKYSVQRDIDSFIDSMSNSNSETIFIIFGLGSGEHIKDLYNQTTDSNKIIIIEPSPAVIKEVIKLDNYIELFKDDRVALCYLDDKIRRNLSQLIEEHNIDNIKIDVFSNYNIIFDKEYKFLIDEIESMKNNKKIGNNTLNTFSYLFFNNYMENVFSLDEFYTVNYLKDKYKGKPAIIVSAGPSLNKNIHLLKEVQNKFIIITGPRTLGTLINQGIKPDFLCEVDPQEEVYNFVKDYIYLEIPLVFMDSASSKLVKEQKGLKIIAANQGMEKYLEEMLGVEVDSILQGGSVAHFCMGLAVYMGCSTVIFIGQDLAYTNEKFQAEGTYAEEIDKLKYQYENNKEEWNKDKNYNIYVKDIYGNKVRTSSILNSYREEFENLIYGCTGIKFINSTEGGAHINGTEAIDLKNSIRLHGAESLDKNLEKLIDSKIIINKETFINKMLKIVGKLEIIKKACEEGLKYSEQMMHFYKDNKKCNINKVFRELDRIDNIINNKKDLGFFAYKVVAAINNVLENETFKTQKNESEKECGIRLAKKSFAIYLAVLITVEEMIFQIKDSLIHVNFYDDKSNLYSSRVKEAFQIGNLYSKKSDKIIGFSSEQKHIKGNKLVKDNVIFGSYDYSDDLLSVYTKKDTVYNNIGYKSIILLDNTYMSDNIVEIEFSQEEDICSYFIFVDDKTAKFYHNIKDNKTLNRYDFNKHFFYGFFIEQGDIGVNINSYGIGLKQKTKRINTQIKNRIILNFNEKVLLINSKKIPMNEYIMNKYLTNKYLGIINSSKRVNAKFLIKGY